MSSDRASHPRSTYRLQLGPELTFSEAATLAGYLADLGVTHAYLSPILTAGPGSTHGYDVVDHSRVAAQLGGARGFAVLAKAMRACGVGIVLDIVPNHMAIPVPESLNQPLWGVLRDGPGSPYATWFDIDWIAGDSRIVLPVLDGPLEDNLSRLSISRRRDREPVLRYFDHRFPLAPGTEAMPVEEALAHQHYRLADWRTAATARNYRRFMDISTLIGLRVEDKDVFAATHATIVDLVKRGLVDGLRVDHPDGLADPGGYLSQLAGATESTWTVVEKILADAEPLPPDWASAGTTGYDSLTAVNGLLVDAASQAALNRIYEELTESSADFAAVAETCKRQILRDVLPAELDRLAHAAGGDLEAAREAAIEVLCRLAVYRPFPSSPRTIAALDDACARAQAVRPDLADRIAALRTQVVEGTEVAARFGQLAAVVYAKGVEDTAFYRHARLLSLNEVGGDPEHFGATVEEFHTFAATLQERWPTAMTTLSTHDTKRSEDVRARIAVLSELPDQWETAVRRWLVIGERLGCPDRLAGYFFWQTMVGAWPLDVERASRYMEKATREAKLATSWLAPNELYDRAVRTFVKQVFDDDGLMADVGMFVATIEPFAAANSLVQKLIQLTMPGVPDTYQGAELATFVLVDPDNRGPVDYGVRREALQSLLDDKLRVTASALRLRRDHPDWFAHYRPLRAAGPAADHLVAFSRSESLITLATRLSARLRAAGGWRDTTLALPPGTWVDALSGREHAGAEWPVAELLRSSAVALLVPGVSLTS